MQESWAAFFKAKFDMLILLLLAVGLLAFTLHMSHDAMDRDMVSWGREECATAIGALLTLITGARLLTNHSQPPPSTLPPLATPPIDASKLEGPKA